MNRTESIEAVDTISLQIEEILSRLVSDETKNWIMGSIGQLIKLTRDVASPRMFRHAAVIKLDKGGFLRYDYELPFIHTGNVQYEMGGVNIHSKFVPRYEPEQDIFFVTVEMDLPKVRELSSKGWSKVK